MSTASWGFVLNSTPKCLLPIIAFGIKIIVKPVLKG
jgi:hypothetical protein